MKPVVMIDLPEQVQTRLDSLIEFYGLPGDLLLQKYIVDVINDVYVTLILELKKKEQEAKP